MFCIKWGTLDYLLCFQNANLNTRFTFLLSILQFLIRRLNQEAAVKEIRVLQSMHLNDCTVANPDRVLGCWVSAVLGILDCFLSFYQADFPCSLFLFLWSTFLTSFFFWSRVKITSQISVLCPLLFTVCSWQNASMLVTAAVTRKTWWILSSS